VTDAAAQKLNEARDRICQTFLDKEEIARLMTISLLAGENLVLIGPPGTAKSAVIRMLSRLMGCRYFEYLMTRFTEPNELFGPVDIAAFREGRYERRTEGMLPEAEIVFLDEVFKANSAILNSLLTLLNERLYVHGNQTVEVPLLALFGASNEVPEDEDLQAMFDRFLLRVWSDNLPSHHFHGLLDAGSKIERAKMGAGRRAPIQPLLDADALAGAQRRLAAHMNLTGEFRNAYKNLVFQLRNEGVRFSDRRAVKMLKLFAASAMLRGAPHPTPADLFLLKHAWNTPGQRRILEDLVDPVVDGWVERHPDEARPEAPRAASLETLSNELGLIEGALAGGPELSDSQLFNHLRNLNDLRNALLADGRPAAGELRERVDALLDGVYAAGWFADV
jgi:MoxR-like ATPase